MGALVSQDLLQDYGEAFLRESIAEKYSYHFTWLGQPIIQYPQDIVALQEIIWRTQPDCIIETGIAHGGSALLYASLLSLLGRGKVIAIDIALRESNREALCNHPLASYIDIIDGSSIDAQVVDTVRERVSPYQKIMVCLDANHTHEHVLAELACYAEFVSAGQYLVVFDTLIEDMPANTFPDRPWSVGNNPATAVKTFLQAHPEFQVDREIEQKLIITACAGGYLRRY